MVRLLLPGRGLRAAAAAFVTTAAASAQAVLVVDGLNRPGAQFTDLPAAVAAARSGDVLRVRADGGAYTSFTTAKALTICADLGQAILRTDVGGPVTVTNLSAGQQFTLRGFLVGPRNQTGPVVRIASCSGRVVLHGLEIGLGLPSVEVRASSAVLIQECRVLGGFPSLDARSSSLQCVGATLQGGAADDRSNQPSAPAVALSQCRAVFAACQLIGGIGRGAQPPSPALQLLDSSADAGQVAGAGSARAGAAGLGGAGAASAVAGRNSSLRRDPALPLVPTGAAPAVAGGVNATVASFPGLLLDTRSRLAMSLRSRDVPGAPSVLLVGLPGGPNALPGIAGDLWLDPNATFVAPRVPSGLAMPRLPFGVVLVGQVAALSQTSVELSNAAMLVMR